MYSGWRTLKKNDFSASKWSYLIHLESNYKKKYLQLDTTLPWVIHLTEDDRFTNHMYRSHDNYDLPHYYEKSGIIIGYI